MAKSRLDILSSFLRKRYKLVLVLWIIALIAFGTQITTFFGAVDYNIAGQSFGGPTNSESQQAQNILDAQFPSSNGSSGNNGIIVVLQNGDMYSSQVQSALIGLNTTLGSDSTLSGSFTGMDSIYSTEYSTLSSVVPSLLPAVALLNSSVGSIASGAHSLFTLDTELIETVAGINQTAQLVYGVPSEFVQAWSAALPNCAGSGPCATQAVNQTFYSQLAANPNPQTIAYYKVFVDLWNQSFPSQPNAGNPSPQVREQTVVQQAVSEFVEASGVSAQEVQTLTAVASGLNATDFYSSDAIVNATVVLLQPEIPQSLVSSLGITLNGLVTGLIGLGTSPTNSTVQVFTLQLFAKNISGASASGLNSTQLVEDAYSLGATPTASSTWDLASSIVANSTAASFAASPLFTFRAPALASLLSSFSAGYSSTQVAATIKNLIIDDNYLEYPAVLSRSITSNFVSPDNGTMIVIYNFDVSPTDSMIAAFRSDISASGVPALGTYYVTGGAVLTADISKVFGPVVGITVVPGVLASLAIVGILLFAPLAAIIPVLVGGIAIGISLPVIYFGVVDIGHGTLTFLTPALTILLVLGLAVDYSVLQLRRTREERVKGKTTEESVALSVRWAGQAVLTAGVTVVVAYIVMAVANVPLFSSVGTAIAIAVSILIAAALTLLPSIELLLKDRLFWPGLKRQLASQGMVKHQKRSRVRMLGEKTLHRKLVVVVIIALFAAGAFYIAVITPSGADILKLFPNFQSNEGLTVLTENLGSATTDPAVIVVTTATPVLQSDGQFNQTLMNQIESISATAASVDGVVSVASPTRPYGETFNYSGVQELPQPEKAQYLSGMYSFVGKNNETVQIIVGLESDTQSQAAINTLLKMESTIAKSHPAEGLTLYYGGTTQSTYDSQAFLNGILPEVIIVLAAGIYVILFLQLRSLFTPLRLVLTILCSVAFSLAMLAGIFYYALGLPILDFAPLFVVVTMLGVGIDYDIFFVTRIREEAMKGKSDNEAIKTALEKTWVTILGLGLVLATVFSSLIVTGIGLLEEIGFVVAAAVVIDVGIVVLFFVTALMGLAARFNWWPSSLTKRKILPEGTETEE